MADGCSGLENRESIHSGQFMVSQFEAEDEQEDDDEIEDEETMVKSECTDVQLYHKFGQPMEVVPSSSLSPQTVAPSKRHHQELSIEISLSKLFKCMQLAYKQKLTSPKWNSFKGIRLPWKDKIRLNNLIWRCWHMQFIMKKRTSCQFASPLDCDIHNKPESVVLEGKYWKRNSAVIKAEYKKWRRFNRHRALDVQAALEPLDSNDLDWLYDKHLMNVDDNQWTSDILFSTFSQPFAFPDHREIARFGAIADFIQPSLGPLQPSLSEFMDTIDLFGNPSSTDAVAATTAVSNRLPSVPEEDLYKVICGYPPNSFDQAAVNEAAAVIEQETDQQMAVVGGSHFLTNSSSNNNNNSNSSAMMNQQQQQQHHHHHHHQMPMGDDYSKGVPSLHYTAQMFSQQQPQSHHQMQQQQSLNQFGILIQSNQSPNLNMPDQSTVTPRVNSMYNTGQHHQQQQQQQQSQQSQSSGSHEKGGPSLRAVLGKSFSRRDPHNYDKSMPTPHQTILYNQILNEQQQQQHNNRSVIHQNVDVTSSTSNNSSKCFMGAEVSSTSQSALGGGLHQPLQHHTMQQQQQQSVEMVVSGSKEFRSHSLPLNGAASMQQMMANLFEINIEPGGSGSSGMPPLHPPPHHQQQQQHIQQQQPQHDFRSPKFPKMSPTRNLSSSSSFIHKVSVMPQLHTANSEPALMQLLQQSKPSVSPVVALRKTPPLPLLVPKLEKSYSFQEHTINSSNNLNNSSSNATSSASASCDKQQQYKSVNSAAAAAANSGGNRSRFPQLSPNGGGPSSSLDSQVVTSPSEGSPGGNESSAVKRKQDGHSDTAAGDASEMMNRRSGHIHSEQKRRIHIKNGFDVLHSLIPQLQHSPTTKMSKAAVLQKGADYIKQLRIERHATSEKMDSLKKERDLLNTQINKLQSLLPANGAPVSRQRTGRILDMYHQYVQSRTLDSWKFWIFGLLFEPLLISFNSTVSVASLEDLQRTAMLWVDQNCSLVELRPAITSKLSYLATTTDILSEHPSSLRDEVIKLVNKPAPAAGITAAPGTPESAPSTPTQSKFYGSPTHK